MKVKSKKYFHFTDFFAKIKPLLTHVRKTPPLRSRYCVAIISKQLKGQLISKQNCRAVTSLKKQTKRTHDTS